MAIELIRQFYDVERTFRITGDDGTQQYISMDNAALQGGTSEIAGETFATAEPIFDVKPRAQRQNPYTTLSQNELALQFYNLGFFNPQMAEQALMCIDMMDFEGKEKIKQSIQKNSMLQQQLQQYKQIAELSAQALAAQGDTRVMDSMQQQGLMQAPPMPTNNQTVKPQEPANDIRFTQER